MYKPEVDTYTPPKPKVRPYTPQERAAINQDGDNSPEARAARLIRTHFIDSQRYREAMVSHLDMRHHFSGQITASYEFVTRTLGIMIMDGQIQAENFDEITVNENVSYSGEETRVQISISPPVLESRADMVA
jgi:hypothetical protein